MFGVRGTGDTSGYGGLVQPDRLPRRRASGPTAAGTTRSPTRSRTGCAPTASTHAIEQVVVHRGEITFHVRREDLLAVAQMLRDDPRAALRALLRRQRRALPRRHRPRAARGLPPALDDPQPPDPARGHRARRRPAHPDASSAIYPTNDWHERETFDMFGIVFDGHPALTRILMPDDWPGHPQRKDYPLGGIPVEYKGGTIPPPDQRRSLQLMTHRQTTSTPARSETTEGRVFTVTGQDWDSITQGLGRRGRRRAGRRQHGPAAPVDPRRAPADPRARGRDGDRGPLRHRLPPHRHREEHGVPLLGRRASRSAPGWTTSRRSTTR